MKKKKKKKNSITVLSDLFYNTFGQMLLFFLGLREILPLFSKQLRYFSSCIIKVAIAQPHQNNNHLLKK